MEQRHKQRQNAYKMYYASNEMWKKSQSISNFLIENTKSININPIFVENVRSFIGELNGLKNYNNRNVSQPFSNKCCDVIIPHLQKIINIFTIHELDQTSMSLIRHEVYQIQIMTNKMIKRFDKLF